MKLTVGKKMLYVCELCNNQELIKKTTKGPLIRLKELMWFTRSQVGADDIHICPLCVEDIAISVCTLTIRKTLMKKAGLEEGDVT